tara:strand:+ start:357 stop:632 length:276 start_codon:yes stop_codon:yes gene_type:complete
VTKEQLVEEMQSRLEARQWTHMHTSTYTELAVSVMFEVTAEQLTKTMTLKEKEDADEAWYIERRHERDYQAYKAISFDDEDWYNEKNKTDK